MNKIIQNFNELSSDKKDKAISQLDYLKENKLIKEKTDAAKFFDKNSYVVIKDFISKEICNLLYEKIKLSAKNLAFMLHYEDYIKKEIKFKLDKNVTFYENIDQIYGRFNDKQALGDYSKYGDPVFDTLLKINMNKLEDILCKKLYPTYTYHRLYTTGTILERHKDRPSCEISATVCLGFDTSNLNEKYNWKIYVEKNEEEKGIELEPGDMLIYRGCDIDHWREPFKGLNHAQVFLHFNENKDSFENLNDGRNELGLNEFFRYLPFLKY